jgi:hypothetical protein
MATIPLRVAQRRLDTGNVVQYPDRSPLGEAMQQSEAHVDHIDPVNPLDATKIPGSNSYKNLRLVAGFENIEKSNK